jgi:triacylglycerol lipase|tara:strand:- start:2676 stop:3428 length:753 start_codon:yes stop_codon:yes gene_type:complete
MAKTKARDLSKSDRALIAAKLSALAYKSDVQAEAKSMGFTKAEIISKDGAEVLVVRNKTDMWFAFRGTEPSKLNDVMADLKVFKNAAMAGGKVHGGFQQELDDIWPEIVKELSHNEKAKTSKDVYFTGHSLGAAMATISATRYCPQELLTFGSPRVGGNKFIKNIKCTHYRFMNNNDIVCRLPPAWLGFRHHGDMIYFDCDGNRAVGPSWRDFFKGVLQSWKRWKFFDAVVDHGMPNYVAAINNQAEGEK